MRLHASPKLAAYLALGGVFLLAAVALGRVELAALGLPFLLALVLGQLWARPPELRVGSGLTRQRALEGEPAQLLITVGSERPLPWLEVTAEVPPALRSGAPAVWRLRLPRAGQRRLEIPLATPRWGVYELGRLGLRAQDALGFFTFERALAGDLQLRVYPQPLEVRSLVAPRETQLFSGNQVSRRKGEGLEFADVRPYLPGDRVRQINWRLSTRLGRLHINEQHPERNNDVVIFLDTYSDLPGLEGGLIGQAVRGAVALAQGYLRWRDRVGLIAFGGILRWLTPGTGELQAYRMIEALIESQAWETHAWKGIGAIPVKTLPPKSLLLCISPLEDERTVQAIFDLRARGFDVAVVEVSTVPYLQPDPTPGGTLAYALWELERRALRERLQALGVGVAQWTAAAPLAAAMEELSGWREAVGLIRL